MYVLSVLRKAVTPLTVAHGTREKDATKKLLRSNVTGQGLGTLIPDAILHAGGTVRGIVDAKYKLLHPSESSPNGPQREDLYQMAAYLGRFRAPAENQTLGVLAYPLNPNRTDTPYAELNSPWSLDEYKRIGFICLPHESAAAIEKMRYFFVQLRGQYRTLSSSAPAMAGM